MNLKMNLKMPSWVRSGSSYEILRIFKLFMKEKKGVED